MTLNVMDICRKAKASAGHGRRLHVASSFPATADEPSTTPSHSAQAQVAAEPAPPQPATEKKYRLPSGQKVPAADLSKRADQRTAVRREFVEVRGPEERGAEPRAAEPPQSHQLFLSKALDQYLNLQKAKMKFYQIES